MKWVFEKRIVRDVSTFAAGFLGFAHEVIITEGERPTLLLACLALMGVPFFLRRDESEIKSETPPQKPELPPSPPPSPPDKRSS